MKLFKAHDHFEKYANSNSGLKTTPYIFYTHILFFIYIYLPVFSFERNETYISIKLNKSEYQT